MTLLLSLEALAQRKRDVQADSDAMGGLARSLQRELHDALDVPVPDGKSRLTRHGGRCQRCTALLVFDPRQPRAHACPSCATVYTDDVHHQWWLMNAHLWTAEQCTRAAVLAYLLDDVAAARRADAILDAYTTRYASWPNRDNALGPTRPFFSTYLESIWLLHLTIALDLRETAEGEVGWHRVEQRKRLILPSAKLIASFDEGRSNRQVWHCAALLAASGLLADSPLERPAMQRGAARSLVTLLRDGLHADGSWYEGENYHLFAHRGLLSAVTLAERAAVQIPAELLQRFEAGFAAPFRTMLPDGTFPSRRDSQYGVTLRQCRIADWLECGLARVDTPSRRAALAMLYAPFAASGPTGRAVSTADAERNVPAVRLTRADCNWRTLLLGRLHLPSLNDARPESDLLEGQGLAVFRRDRGRFWIGLDYGDPGAGHGHPDRLNLVIATTEARWLDDVGTGSYTSPTLQWYRSSMAHNAPFVNGRDQGAARGTLLAHDEQEGVGWVSAAFVDPASDVRFVRTVVVMADHVVDEMTWTSASKVFVDVPLQALINPAGDPSAWTAFTPGTTQDGVLVTPFARAVAAGQVLTLELRALPSPATGGGVIACRMFECALWSETPATLWRAGTIGPPAGRPHGLLALRQLGRSGRSVRVLAAPGVIANVQCTQQAIIVQHRTSGAWSHTREAQRWHIQHGAGALASSIVLRGGRAVDEQESASRTPLPRHAAAAPGLVIEMPAGRQYGVALQGAEFYRHTEQSYTAAGSPEAQVTVAGAPGLATIRVEVQLHREPAFALACAENPLDNEPADINSDGVQLHWCSVITDAWNSVIAVPEPDGVRLTAATGSLDGLTATWTPAVSGYSLGFALPLPANETIVALDVCINDRPAGRERRRGQLVLSGGHGETAYLRGARQDPGRAMHFIFRPDPQ